MSGLSKYIPAATKLLSKTTEVASDSFAGKTVFFYFSASWCPPCRGFTPVFAEFYNKYHKEKNFEVIFISWDEEQESHDAYFAKMPWLSVPFENKALVQSLVNTFNVKSIPTVIGINADTGAVVTTTARAKIPSDPEGKNFPWSD